MFHDLGVYHRAAERRGDRPRGGLSSTAATPRPSRWTPCSTSSTTSGGCTAARRSGRPTRSEAPLTSTPGCRGTHRRCGDQLQRRLSSGPRARSCLVSGDATAGVVDDRRERHHASQHRRDAHLQRNVQSGLPPRGHSGPGDRPAGRRLAVQTVDGTLPRYMPSRRPRSTGTSRSACSFVTPR